MLEELIKVENGRCSARELHKVLGLTERFNKWFEKYSKEDNKYRFVVDKDFEHVKAFTSSIEGTRMVTREKEDALITIDMAKHICMLTGTDKAFEIREYFIKCEEYILKTGQLEAFNIFRRMER